MKPFTLSLAMVVLLACQPTQRQADNDHSSQQLTPTATTPTYDITEKSLQTIQADLANDKVNSATLVKLYLDRIEQLDRIGANLHSVISINPDATAQAQALDKERAEKGARSPLHGIPVLLKDNIESLDDMPTTAGSLALQHNVTKRDAPLVAKLRAAGAIILGKTNLSEWANIRSSRSTSGWSAVGGLVKNPYALDRNTCGSSSGTGAAIAASLATLGVGTETDGSITCPSSANGLVGLKPTVGLVSRSQIVPISHSQDSAGPMTRDVYSAAALLNIISGSDEKDAATKLADEKKVNYLSRLEETTLNGKRFGVLRYINSANPEVNKAFEFALETMRAAGAQIIDIEDKRNDNALQEKEFTVLITELKADLDAYLSTTPPSVSTRTLADVIQFNNVHAAEEMTFFGQEIFEQAVNTNGLLDKAYLKARDSAQQIARDAIDGYLKKYHVEALLFYTLDPAWQTDLVNGDHYTGGGAGYLPAIAGYPHLTVPMANIHGLPVGLSFVGTAWSEAELLNVGYAFEQLTHARKIPVYAKNSLELVGLK